MEELKEEKLGGEEREVCRARLGQSPTKENGLHLMWSPTSEGRRSPPYPQQVPSTYRHWFKFFADVTAHRGLAKAP